MSGETNNSDNVKDGIQQIKQLRQEQRERKMKEDTINQEQID